MKYFGTDGIRGIVGEKLNESLIRKVARGIVLYFNKNPSLKRQILVGNDGRISANYILSLMCGILLKNGIEVHSIGICTSPALAFITKKFVYPLGIMLSASHNSYEYNGIKFFNSAGEKTDDNFEIKFEQLMDLKTQLKNKNYAYFKHEERLMDSYYFYLKEFTICTDVIFDCACGGAAKIIKNILPKCKTINADLTGTNINSCSGCTHPDRLIMECINNQKIGFAFDGDADRILVVDKNGNCYDGDAVLYLFSKFFCHTKNVVGTIYSNQGLEEALNSIHITLLRAGVGDKLVCKKMKEVNSLLGGEKSGHIIIKPYTHTGDGVLCALLILKILNTTKKSLSELMSGFAPYFQAQDNVTLTQQFTKNPDEILKTINLCGAKVIIRPSGTEPILRIMVEHKDEKIAKNLLNLIKNELILH